MPHASAADSTKAALRAHPLQSLLVGPTFVAGMVDAITYLNLGHGFTANMTGNLVLLLGAGTGALLVRGAGVPFAIGAAVGVLALQTVGYLMLRRRSRPSSPRPWAPVGQPAPAGPLARGATPATRRESSEQG